MTVFTVLILQVIALIVCIGIKVYTKRLLDDIDGFKGISTSKEVNAAKGKPL